MLLKTNILHSARRSGLFWLTSQLTRKKLLVLCYHGNSFLDEHEFWPSMFHTREQFEERFEYLRKHDFTVLTLDDALNRLNNATLGRRDLAITIDDGFYSTYAIAAPVMEAVGMTATIYVTSYYMRHQNPIYRLAIKYMFWKTRAEVVDMSTWIPNRAKPVALGTAEATAAIEDLVTFGETQTDEPGRVAIAREVGRRLGVDYDELARSRRLSLMTEAEVADLARRGFDIQLHTHRHRCAPDNVRQEIVENREALTPLAGMHLTHLCYPSGIWSKSVWPVLHELGIRSATTCDVGLNDPQTHAFALKRILDVGTMPLITFEAEINGFMHLVRTMTGRATTYPHTVDA